MLKSLRISQIYVLDQPQALDFYVGKLGLEVGDDINLGYMRWLTVNVPGDRDRTILLEQPGPPSMDEKAAAVVREQLTKGQTGGHLFLHHRRLQEDLRGAGRQGRRVHRGPDRAPLRHRLRAPRPVRQPHPLLPDGRQLRHQDRNGGRDQLKSGIDRKGPAAQPPAPSTISASSSSCSMAATVGKSTSSSQPASS